MANLAVVQGQGGLSSFQHWDREQLELIKTQISPDCSDQELMLFGQVCQRTGLDPFARQIYAIRRKDGGSYKMSIQTSIDGFRLIADRTGQYAGSDDPKFDEGLSLFEHLKSDRGNPLVATTTVWKMVGGVRCPFTASASWGQYAQVFWKDSQQKLAPLWQKMPHLMLSKCSESLALRKAFPAELSGLYTREEMGQADNPVEHAIAPPNNNKKRIKTVCTALGISSVAEFYKTATQRIPQVAGKNSATLTDEECQFAVEAIMATWAVDQQAFTHFAHAQNAVKKFLRVTQFGTDEEMIAAWDAEVSARAATIAEIESPAETTIDVTPMSELLAD